jgi:hypothetical protein
MAIKNMFPVTEVWVLSARGREFVQSSRHGCGVSKRINVPGNLGSPGDELIDLLQASVFDCLNFSMWL